MYSSFRAVFILIFTFTTVWRGNDAQNLTCYQCTRNTDTECSPEELLPCSKASDRCVTHVTKNAQSGFSIKRECGLSPCTFTDLFQSKDIGFDHCDRSKDEFFCTYCCVGDGCNKNEGTVHPISTMLFIIIALICILNVVKDFQPPYHHQSE